jgi:hypothetical protein
MRMLAWLALLPVASLASCTCGNKHGTGQPSPAASSSGAATGASTASAPPPPASATAVFSAPIGGARWGGSDVVTGLVAASKLVRAVGFSGAGAEPAWTTDAMTDVTWAPDSDLRAIPTAGGFALVWHGPRDGKSGRTLVRVDAHGGPLGGPQDVGSAYCVTDGGVAWIEARSSGASRVLARAWSEADAHPVTSIPADRDPALLCADHDVVALGGGDDDLSATVLTPGEAAARPPFTFVRDADFGDDDEREHYPYTVGDDLGIVRVGSSGALWLRRVPKGGAPTAWKRLKHTIPADDDVVAVDGDASSVVIVYTRDADDACPGVASTAESIRALRIDLGSWDEKAFDLAPATCERYPGPFWTTSSAAGTIVAWVDRRAGAAAGAPPILGASFRVLSADGSVRSRSIEQPADALADMGCDARGCAVAALVRPPGGDGMEPEAIQVLAYP